MEMLPLCPFCKKPHGHGRDAVGKVVTCQHCRRTLVPWSRALAFIVLLGSVFGGALFLAAAVLAHLRLRGPIDLSEHLWLLGFLGMLLVGLIGGGLAGPWLAGVPFRSVLARAGQDWRENGFGCFGILTLVALAALVGIILAAQK
jgi:hypothetical protein